MNIAHDERAELLKAQVDSVHEEFDSSKAAILLSRNVLPDAVLTNPDGNHLVCPRAV